MRRFAIVCGAIALAGLGVCGYLLAATLGSSVPPGALFAITPRPVPVFTLPLPPTPPTPPGFTAAPGQVLFVSTRDGAAEVYQMDDSGTGQTRLTSLFGAVADPTQSRSGRLTYSALIGGHWEILAAGLTDTPEQLTHDASRDRESRWIDGVRLVYVSDKSGNDDVWELDTSSNTSTDLTPDDPARDLDPAPSPDGTKIAYASSTSAGSDIFVLTLASKSVVQLTHDGAGNRHPSWSPDGKRIAFDRRGPGGSDIWAMNAADGSDAKPVIATGADEFAPSYAPAPVAGASRFVYVTNANGNYEVWGANDDGTNAFDMSQSPAGDDISAFWAPAPQGEKIEALVLSPTEVKGAGGGPDTAVHCTVAYAGHEPIVGTPYRDIICGSAHADTIKGLGGNDVVYPGGGADTVVAGPGDDTIYARGGGVDTIHGGAGLDTAYVDSGDPPPDVEIPEP